MIIEFAGAPGAGKSTIAAELTSHLQQRGVPVNEPTSKLSQIDSPIERIGKKGIYVLHNTVSNPNTFLYSTCEIHKTKQKNTKMLIKNIFNLQLIKNLYQKCATDGVTILDQGLLQVLWSVDYFSSGETQNIKNVIADAIDKNNIIFVLIEAPNIIIQKRLLNRTDNNNHPSELEESKESISKSIKSYDKIKTIAQDLETQQHNISVTTYSNREYSDIYTVSKSISDQVIKNFHE